MLYFIYVIFVRVIHYYYFFKSERFILELSNFGISESGNVKLLDLDMAYFDRLIPLKPVTKCRQHSDCSFFDCSGYCDRRTRRCHVNRRINNNLQVLCEKVLLKLLKSETIPFTIT